MKILIAYYSRTGNTKKIAEEMAAVLKCDIERIVDLKNRGGMIGWFLAGRDGMKKSMTKIEKIKSDPLTYDIVILGTPIWVNLPPAMRTFIHEYSGRLKKTAFFCTMGSSGYQNLFKEMEDIGKIKPVTTLAITDNEVKTNTYRNRMERYIKELQ